MRDPLDFSEPLSPKRERNRKPDGNTRGILVCAIIGVLCLMTLTYALAVAPWLEKRRQEQINEEIRQQRFPERSKSYDRITP